MTPYILKIERPDLDPIVVAMGQKIDTPGKLVYINYAWFKRNVKANFFHFALYTGAFLLLILEVYRRLVAPHEDERILSEHHGDVE